MGKLTKLTVYVPETRRAAIHSRAFRNHRSVSAYLQFLLEQDQTAKPDPVRGEIERLNARVEELLEISRYSMVVQNATADRLDPGLLKRIQDLYREQAGSAPDAG